MAELRQSFQEFIFSTNTDGSGKAASYVRALDMLGPILAAQALLVKYLGLLAK